MSPISFFLIYSSYVKHHFNAINVLRCAYLTRFNFTFPLLGILKVNLGFQNFFQASQYPA